MTVQTEMPPCQRAREVTAGSWIMAHNDKRKLDYHNEWGVGYIFEAGGVCKGTVLGRGFRTWSEVKADLRLYAAGTQLPIHGPQRPEVSQGVR